ncbi:MAG: regulatory protein RecX [Patescibacteria group bacterium]|nr:regulatory protein RecX [Patescibacteria group bacterium]
MFKRLSKTKEPDNAASAYDYAVFLLSLRLRTVGEMRDKMQQRGYSPEIIVQTLEELHRQRYLDDGRYAEVFLENVKAYKDLGYYGIKKKFLAKRLPVKLVEKVLNEGLSLNDELVIAERVLKKAGYKAKALGGDGDGPRYNTYDEKLSKQKQKLAQKLKSRGFRGEVIAKLIY